MIEYSVPSLPKQKLPDSKKTKKWGQDVVAYYSESLIYKNESVRKRMNEKNENYNLVVGIISEAQMKDTMNPMGLEGEQVKIPYNREIISIINPTLKTLVGEEITRRFEYRVKVMNEEAISEKEKQLKSELDQRILSLIQSGVENEEELQQKLAGIKDWQSYSFQDTRERAASHILNYYWEELKLKHVFNKGFKDALIVGEEIYRIDIVNGNPRVKRINPLNLYTIRSANSPYIEDADVIIEQEYMSPGNTVSEFRSVLSDKDIDWIYSEKKAEMDRNGVYNPQTVPTVDVDYDSRFQYIDYLPEQGIFVNRRGIYKTAEGNIRIVRVSWRSLRKIGFLSYIDQNTGIMLTKQVDENYQVNEALGETIEWEWITEWWQGVRIGEDIYVDVKPIEMQRRDMNDISKSYPPYIGTIYNINDREVRSLVDELKPLQYQWTAFEKRVALLWSRNYGKLVKIDVSKIPDDFDLDLFMNWLTTFGFILEDPFKEGRKGQPSGQFQSAVGVVDAELSTSIQQALAYMMYLRELADEVGGVNRQRRGQMMASDGLGVTQQSITQQTYQTEELFQEHDYLKQRVLEALIETVKHSLLYKDNIKMQYVLDDLTTQILNIDAGMFIEADYGIKVTNSTKTLQLERGLIELAHAGMQNGKLAMSDVIDIYTTPSISMMSRKLKQVEAENIQREEQSKQADRELQMQMQQMMIEEKEKERQHSILLEQMKTDREIAVARMKIETDSYLQTYLKSMDMNHNGIMDDVEIEKQKMINSQAEKELAEERRQFNEEMKRKDEELRIKEKALKTKTQQK